MRGCLLAACLTFAWLFVLGSVNEREEGGGGGGGYRGGGGIGMERNNTKKTKLKRRKLNEKLNYQT